MTTDTTPSPEWEERSASLWAALDTHEPSEFRARIEKLASELPAGHPVAEFERGSAHDSTGLPAQAVVHYRAALDAGLTGIRRRRAVIQMSSSIRNLGRPEESLALLTAEREQGSDELDDALICTLALALTDLNRTREAVALTVGALSRHLPRYNRSMANYAKALLPES
ncbi:tetratricopeptide repeat protein [Streptomyces sp. NPDC050418]|uniref:tetratricopeptide repeat protein n=1 Tax=Streptomyces sp. NPDC050418 TaxID=3365612 RepID=UPI00379DD87E